MSRDSLSLSELIDLEVAAADDRGISMEELRKRDADVGLDLARRQTQPVDELSTPELLRHWIRSIVSQPSVGVRFVGFLAATDLVLLFIGTMLGGSAAFAILHYDGSAPINAIQYLGMFVALQVLLLAVLILSFCFGSRIGVVQEALKSLVYLRSTLLEKIDGGLTTVRRMRKLYSVPESWLLMKVTQRFGLAFNLGALGVTIYLVGFSDLAFSWSTTLAVSAEEFHSLLARLSAPWRFLGPEWTLSIDQIRETQFYRLEGKYVPAIDGDGASDMMVVGSWWRFLVAAHFVYGLLPRLILFLAAKIGLNRSLEAIRFDGLVWGTVRKRILAAVERIPHPSAYVPSDLDSNKVTPSIQGKCRVVTWRDFPVGSDLVKDFVGTHIGAEAVSFHEVGGSAEDVDGRYLAQGKDKTPWVLLVEDWESPGRAFKQLVKFIRSGSDADVLVVPALIEGGVILPPGGDRLTVWRRHVDGLADPQVGVLA